MDFIMDNLITIVITIFASSGFWLLIQRLLDRNSATKRMLLGLAHDRIVYLGIKYMDRGYIIRDEYENLVDYLYKPYKDLGGNGTAERIISEINKLKMLETHPPIKGEIIND